MIAGGNHYSDKFAETVGQQEQVISVLLVACLPCSRTEGNTSKVVEAAASVVAVSMLTSGLSIVDADESILLSTTLAEVLET